MSEESVTTESTETTTSEVVVDTPLGENGERALREEQSKNKAIIAQMKKMGMKVEMVDGKPVVSQKVDPAQNRNDSDDTARSIREEVEREYAPLRKALLTASASAALVEAGLNTNLLSTSEASRLLDLDTVTVDGGQVDNDELRESVNSLKERNPKLFKAARAENEAEDEPRGARRPAGSADIGKKKSAGATKSSAELLVERYQQQR